MRTTLGTLALILVLAGCGSTTAGPETAAGTPAESTTTTAAPTTTTAAPVATEAGLFAAIPSATELPPGWSDQGLEISNELFPNSGNGFGYCGGDNTDSRAETAGVLAHALKGSLVTDKSMYGSVSLYAFGTEDDAQAFMDATEEAVSSCGYVEYEAPEFVEDRDEETTDYRFDGFSGDFEPDEMWEIRETTSLGSAAAEDADSAFFIARETNFLAWQSGEGYGITRAYISQWERHGTVVVRFGIFSRCCTYGFSNSETDEENPLVTYADVQVAADHIRDGLLNDIFNTNT